MCTKFPQESDIERILEIGLHFLNLSKVIIMLGPARVLGKTLFSEFIVSLSCNGIAVILIYFLLL